MHFRLRVLASILIVLWLCPPASSIAAELDIEAVLKPVIALEARIPENARSAPALGTVRGGTGVVIDGSGLVVTIGYLILEASEVDLFPNGLGGGRVPADMVAWDHVTGLGLVRARKPLGIPPMTLGDSTPLRSGDAVIAASWEGLAGMQPSVVVERRVYTGYWEYLLENALFVAPIHPAFPGAALIDLEGRLAGIGGFALTDVVDQDEVVGTVFVPVNRLKQELADLLLEGRSSVNRPWFGLYCEERDGVLQVRRVPDYGPAFGAGVRTGDHVLTVNGVPVDNLEQLYRRLWTSIDPGDRVQMQVRRGASILNVEITAGDRYSSLNLGRMPK